MLPRLFLPLGRAPKLLAAALNPCRSRSRLGRMIAFADRFDYALGPNSTQTEVYEQTNKPLVEKAVQGYNACCFAYGASA